MESTFFQWIIGLFTDYGKTSLVPQHNQTHSIQLYLLLEFSFFFLHISLTALQLHLWRLTVAMNVRRRTHTMGVGAWYNRNANIYCTIKERVLPAVAVRPHIKSNKTIISAEWPTFKRWKKCILFFCSSVVSFRLFSSIKSWESESTCCVYATRGPQWEGIHVELVGTTQR